MKQLHRCIQRNEEEEQIGVDASDVGSGLVHDLLQRAALEVLNLPGPQSKLIFVRGPMGSGLSTVMNTFMEWVRKDSERDDPVSVGGDIGKKIGNKGGRLLEPPNRQSLVVSIDAGIYRNSVRCAEEITKQEATHKCVFVFGSEDFLRSTGKRAYRFFDLLPIGPATQDCRAWVAHFAREHGLDDRRKEDLLRLYQRVASKETYQWANWLDLLAGLIKSRACDMDGTSLEVFHSAIETHYGGQAEEGRSNRINELRDELMSRRMWMAYPNNQILVPELHLQVIRAMLVLNGNRPEMCSLDVLARADKPFEAIELLNAHLEEYRLRDRELRLVRQYIDFLKLDLLDGGGSNYANGHGIYIQGLVGEGLLYAKRWLDNNLDKDSPNSESTLKNVDAALSRFERRLRDFISGGKARTLSVGQLWDLSDTLHKIGGLDERRVSKSRGSRFIHFDGSDQQIYIGSDQPGHDLDPVKPLRPYRRTQVKLPEVWVGKHLVTVAEYREFHQACANGRGREFFEGCGERWYTRDGRFIRLIERDFHLTKGRTLACESSVHKIDQKSVQNYEERIRRRALNEALERERIWQKEPHHRHDRLPVVDVNWWEASAYCRWYSQSKLAKFGFDPEHYEARLVPDWLWEAVLVWSWRAQVFPDEVVSRKKKPDDFAGHIRPEDAEQRPGRVGHLCFPVHVGLFPPRGGVDGPYDMAGNVWEWTASASFAEVVPKSWVDRLRRFVDGFVSLRSAESIRETKWSESMRELDPMDSGRLKGCRPLQMRILRGGSFMSKPQYAWGTCMRTCDPPYYSFQDVGFRIAVFPKEAHR